MQIINLIFNLGVLFSIYSFIWFFINSLLKLISGGKKQTLGEIYFSKAIQYIFLANVTVLFGIQNNGVNWSNSFFSGLILSMYFIGKLQKNERKNILFKQFNGLMKKQNNSFERKYEIIIIGLALCSYIAFLFFPFLGENPVSKWFFDEIISFQKMPILGFIFKVIGFFFLINILIKISNGILFLISGNLSNKNIHPNSDSSNKNDEFDDYEEID